MGLVTARTLALALDVPVHGVPSLDVVAAEVVELGLVPDGAGFTVATDARRREIYWGTYRSGSERALRLTGPDVDRPADAISGQDGAGSAWFGRGVVRYGDVLTPTPERSAAAAAGPQDASAAVLARVALARITCGAAGPDAPLYLRRPDAVEPAARKRVGP